MSMTTSIIAVLLTCFAFTFYNLNLIKNSMIQEVTLLSEVAGSNVAPFIQFSQKRPAKQTLAALDAKQSILLVCIYDTFDELFTFHRPILAKADNIQRCPEAPPMQKLNLTWKFLTVSHMIEVDNEPVGTLFIISDLRDIKLQFQISAMGLGLLFVIVVFIAYLVSNRLQQFISDPILDLAKVAQYVEKKRNFSVRAKHVYNDETGMLADSFNDMMEEIEEHERKLFEANENLEKKVEERTHDLNIAKDAAESANKAKTIFLQNMSHELRTPMHGIRAFSNFGIEESDDESVPRSELKGYFDTIRNSCDRLTELINNILDVTRLEGEEAQLDLQPCDIKEIFDTVSTRMKSDMEKKQLSLNVDIKNAETKGQYDKEGIEKLFYNLLKNAIEYNNKGGSIDVIFSETTSGNKEYTNVSIADTGIGIPENELEMVFDRFSQSSRTSDGSGGTGLGLAICRDIVQAHGGTIQATCNDNGGTTLLFNMPMDGKGVVD